MQPMRKRRILRSVITLLVLCSALAQGNVFSQKKSVRVILDIDYIAEADYENNKDKLDLYLPEGRTRFPVIIAIHGGALQSGDKNGQQHIGQRFASAGFGTVVINYRLSPAVSHPAHIQDTAAAFAWVKRHISEYGGDPDAIFVIGHSAGAYLAALLATDERYLAAHKLTPRDIRGVAPVSAFFYVDRVAPDRPKTVWGTETKAWIEASPSRYIRSNLPPMFLIYADRDDKWRRDQNEEMAEALRKTGNRDVKIKQISGRDHITVWNKIAEGEEVSTQIIDFINQMVDKSKSN